MTRFQQRAIGILIGLALAGAALGLLSRPGRGTPRGTVLSECDGALKVLVIQYVQGADFAIPVYRDFLRQIGPGILVHVACPDRSAYDEFVSRLGPVECRLSPILVGHEMTAWSRDRWLALKSNSTDGPITLLASCEEAAADVWPARAGDQRIAADLAAALGPAVRFERQVLYFDGGDVVADGRTAFITPGLIRRNLQVTVPSKQDLTRVLEATLGRKIVLMEDAPDHHAGMYMMVVGDGTVLVGDPSLARDFALPELPGGADFSAETQRRFDSVAGKAREAGYRVMRIPVAPSTDGRTFLTYVNAIIDNPAGRRIVYLPRYDGAEALNAAGAKVWRDLGYEVRPVNCTSAYIHSGSLHCLVNVLDREIP